MCVHDTKYYSTDIFSVTAASRFGFGLRVTRGRVRTNTWLLIRCPKETRRPAHYVMEGALSARARRRSATWAAGRGRQRAARLARRRACSPGVCRVRACSRACVRVRVRVYVCVCAWYSRYRGRLRAEKYSAGSAPVQCSKPGRKARRASRGCAAAVTAHPEPSTAPEAANRGGGGVKGV